MINQDFKQSEELKKDLQEFELQILAGKQLNGGGKGFESEEINIDLMTNSAFETDRMGVETHKYSGSQSQKEGQLDKAYRINRKNQEATSSKKLKKKV